MRVTVGLYRRKKPGTTPHPLHGKRSRPRGLNHRPCLVDSARVSPRQPARDTSEAPATGLEYPASPLSCRRREGLPIVPSRQAKGGLTFSRHAVGPCGSSRWPDVFHGWPSSLCDLALPYLATHLLLEVRGVQTSNSLMYHAHAGVGRRLERIPPNWGTTATSEPQDLALRDAQRRCARHSPGRTDRMAGPKKSQSWRAPDSQPLACSQTSHGPAIAFARTHAAPSASPLPVGGKVRHGLLDWRRFQRLLFLPIPRH